MDAPFLHTDDLLIGPDARAITFWPNLGNYETRRKLNSELNKTLCSLKLWIIMQ